MRETEAPRRLEAGPGGQCRPREGISSPLITKRRPQSGSSVGRGRARGQREGNYQNKLVRPQGRRIQFLGGGGTMRGVIWPKRAINWPLTYGERFHLPNSPRLERELDSSQGAPRWSPWRACGHSVCVWQALTCKAFWEVPGETARRKGAPGTVRPGCQPMNGILSGCGPGQLRG